MAKARIISAKPTRAKIKRFFAPAAASGLPEERINWIPEMTIKMTVKKPAMVMIGRRKPEIKPAGVFRLQFVTGPRIVSPPGKVNP